jgi:pyrimidine operon attenuation protein/uracil phosphoribosyltransferase
MPLSKPVFSASGVQRALARIAHQIAEVNHNPDDVVVVGIQTGGVNLAQRLGSELAKIWGIQVPVGQVDVSMHRDDFNQRIASPMHPTTIPFHLDGKIVVLVDDVLYSGRTVRAALDSLNDFGRPKAIQLAVMIDRGNRQLPIKADFIGKEVLTAPDDYVEVRLKDSQNEDLVFVRKS